MAAFSHSGKTGRSASRGLIGAYLPSEERSPLLGGTVPSSSGVHSQNDLRQQRENPAYELREALYSAIRAQCQTTIPNVVEAIKSGDHDDLVRKLQEIGKEKKDCLMQIMPNECVDAILNYKL